VEEARARAPRPGGRTAANRSAALTAALQLVAREGLDRFTREDVAALAGIHKTTVYRRWASTDDIVVEALAGFIGQSVPVPDTGETAGDLEAFAHSVVDLVNHPISGPLVRALLTSSRASAPVTEVMQRFWRDRLLAIAPIGARALERGDWPAGTDVGAVMAQLGAPIYYRILVLGREVDHVDAVLAARAADAAARAGVFAPGSPQLEHVIATGPRRAPELEHAGTT
jgi:AcrR family transcriptional regulator